MTSFTSEYRVRMEAVIFVGLQGAGKTTFYVQRFLHTHLRISHDLLKTRNREERLLQFCLDTRMRFVVDKTNATIAERARYINPAREQHFRIIAFYFELDVSGSLQRNDMREGKQRVPKQAIFATRHRLQPPTLDEGFDELFVVRVNDGGNFLVEGGQDAASLAH